MPHFAMRHGEFYGHRECRRSTEGLQLSVLAADPRRVVERHTHDDAHWILVLDGWYRSSAHGASSVESGAMLIFNPVGTTHRDTFLERPQRSLGAFFALSIAPCALAQLGDETTLPHEAIAVRNSDALRVAQQGVAAARSTHPTRLTLESIAAELLGALVRRPRCERGRPLWFRSACELLRDECASTLTIAETARAVGVHPVHLARVFRQFERCSPGEYARRARADYAAALLSESRVPLSDVAQRAGYADQSHLSKAMRRYFGRTPGELRGAGQRVEHGEPHSTL